MNYVHSILLYNTYAHILFAKQNARDQQKFILSMRCSYQDLPSTWIPLQQTTSPKCGLCQVICLKGVCLNGFLQYIVNDALYSAYRCTDVQHAFSQLSGTSWRGCWEEVKSPDSPGLIFTKKIKTEKFHLSITCIICMQFPSTLYVMILVEHLHL